MTKQNAVQWVYSSKDVGELRERYNQWAPAYNHDLEKAFGWSAPQLAADVFARYVPTCARVLDAGAGTGLVGRAAKGERLRLHSRDGPFRRHADRGQEDRCV